MALEKKHVKNQRKLAEIMLIIFQRNVEAEGLFKMRGNLRMILSETRGNFAEPLSNEKICS